MRQEQKVRSEWEDPVGGRRFPIYQISVVGDDPANKPNNTHQEMSLEKGDNDSAEVPSP